MPSSPSLLRRPAHSPGLSISLEYIIKRYAPSPEAYRSSLQEGWIDDSYWSQFAEASFMPVAVMKIVFAIVPTQAPFLVRPLVSAICGGVVTGFVDPGETTRGTTTSPRAIQMHCLATANECYCSAPDRTY